MNKMDRNENECPPKFNFMEPTTKIGKRVGISVWRGEAVEFGNFIVEKISADNSSLDDRVIDLTQLWRVFCYEQALRVKDNRLARNRKIRPCYGSCDSNNQTCFAYCPLYRVCKLDTEPGYHRCHDCSRIAYEDNNQCELHLERSRARSRFDVMKRKLNGACQGCGKPLPEGFKTRTCPLCVERRRNTYRRRKERRVKYGLCIRCGRPKSGYVGHDVSYPVQMCQSCRLKDKRRKETRKRRMEKI